MMPTEGQWIRTDDLPLRRELETVVGRVHLLEAGLLWLDGGAMFGVVPKALWQRRIPADERNRIPLAMRCMLFELAGELVLVDTGAGSKDDAKFRDIYGLDNAGDPTRLEDGIRDAGYSPDDVTIVINTHLHFDHAGGNTVRREDGEIVPAFPRARYVVQRREWEFAQIRNERIRASYPSINFDAVYEAGRFEFVDGEVELLPGLRLLPTPGHTPHHQCVLLGTGDATVCYLADLVPTAAHLPLPWIMGYDLEPLVTLETKRRVLGQAREEGWLLVFEHDATVATGRLDPTREQPTLIT